MPITIMSGQPVEVYTKAEVDKLLSGGSAGGGGGTDPLLPIVDSPPRITTPGNSKVIGVTMTRAIGLYADGWRAVAGLWRIAGTQTEIGRQPTCSSATVSPGESVQYFETVTHESDPRSPFTAESAVFGPFVAAPTAPSPEPAPTPPPAGSRPLNDDELERAIRCSLGLNESRIQGLNPEPDDRSWQSGGAMTQGSWWNGLQKSWNWPTGNAPPAYIWPNFDWWAVLFTADGNATDDMWLDVMDFDTQFLVQGESAWKRIKPVQQRITWANNFAPNMITSLGTVPKMRPGLDGGTSVNLPRQGNVHFGCGTITEVPDRDRLEGVYVSMRYRLDPRSTGKMAGLAQVGGDPKHQMGGMSWWPGFGVSASMDAADDWRHVYFINVAPSRNGSIPRRLITLDRLRAVRPLR